MRIGIVYVSLVPEEVDTVEDLFLIERDLATMDAGFQKLGLETPEWISEKRLTVNNEITSRVRAELLRRLKKDQARYESMAPKEEVRAQLRSNIAELEKKLGLNTAVKEE